jgi:hypothetical protein
MFAVLHSDINCLKFGLLYLTGQPYYKKSRSAKVKDGIINLILRNYLIDRITTLIFPSKGGTCLSGSTILHENIRLGCKVFYMKNALAYLS